ncbi:fluoride efflux transporter CrcB [Leptolyngbya sp. NK1-12]|uniref:Fluoride efflux transporter CrcB n=1 Tax=Leptolyngbya sp. NK1-12 TaxID=2547451 RepID=A0AA97AGU2_9CYAN|nr:hypothetical protein [Leptolyngbya sp. NK1-12]WNZ24705.1 fluoride efflux transporter CrcB [Leptolyngbya sp. NK1-12]
MLKQPVVRTVVAISLGAIAGALWRYYLGLGIGHLLGTAMPYGTLVINFSSYELDSAKLLSQRDLQADLIYWTGSVLPGIISLQLGITLAEWVLKRLDQDWSSDG